MLQQIGKSVMERVDPVLDMAALFVAAMKELFSKGQSGGKLVFDVILRQILFTGVEGMRVITVIALLLGGAVIIEAFTQLPRVGGDSIIGSILIVVVVRELGPILTAFLVIGRSGTAISTEIGYMMVNHEVQALEMMGINPIRFIVLPRLLGVAAAIFCLSFYFNLVSLFGGYFFARLIVDYPFARFLEDVSYALSFWDVAVSGIKCLLFGFIVALICCYRGFSVRVSFTEIPQVTTRAVVLSIYACFIVNLIITAFFYI